MKHSRFRYQNQYFGLSFPIFIFITQKSVSLAVVYHRKRKFVATPSPNICNALRPENHVIFTSSFCFFKPFPGVSLFVVNKHTKTNKISKNQLSYIFCKV